MLKYNGRIITKNDRWIGDVKVPLPLSTARFRFSDPTYDPRTEDRWSSSSAAARWSKVPVSGNVWDYTYLTLQYFADDVWHDRNFDVELIDTNIGTNLASAFRGCNNLIKVHNISVNPTYLNYAFSSTGITEIPMFDTSSCWTFVRAWNDTPIRTIPLLDTSNATSFNGLFSNCTNLEYVPALNTSKVTDVSFAFWYCHNLRALPDWDLSKVSNFECFCQMNSRYNPNLYIEEIPDYDVSSAVNVSDAFLGLPNVKYGMYRMYQKLAGLGSQITNHTSVFSGTGTNTPEGLAERALIPQSWGGDLVEE